MTILFVIDSLGTGGAERSTADLWKYLVAQGVSVHIAVLRKRKEGIQEEVLKANYKVYFLQGHRVIHQSTQIGRLVRKIRPDIVHSILFKSNLRTRFARVRQRFVHVESLVNCTYDPVRLKDPGISRIGFYVYKALDRSTCRFVDHFHAITEVVKEHYHAELKIPKSKIHVIYRGRDENKFVSERISLRDRYLKEFNLPDNAILTIHVGRQEFQKGHLDLLNAISNLSQEASTRAVFLFVGREGNSSTSIRDFLSRNAIQQKMFWLGHRYDVPELLTAADIFTFPSLYEGLGGALIEAQAAALPIVCTDLPVLNEVVLKNENALMHRTVAELTANLTSLLVNPEMRQTMGAKGLANFRSKFVLERVNKQTLDFYNSICR